MKYGFFAVIIAMISFSACTKPADVTLTGTSNRLKEKIYYLAPNNLYHSSRDLFIYVNDTLRKIERTVVLNNGTEEQVSYDSLIYRQGFLSEKYRFDYDIAAHQFKPAAREEYFYQGIFLKSYVISIYNAAAARYDNTEATGVEYTNNLETKRRTYDVNAVLLKVKETKYQGTQPVEVQLLDGRNQPSYKFLYTYSHNQLATEEQYHYAMGTFNKRTSVQYSYNSSRLVKESYVSYAPYGNDVDSVRYRYY
ncbi:hypothetical protein [Sediminibacterium ginsengisoli]|uniref:DUF4595 domain-containing protein n=1 Tax=Sediminibacterium ginsengisoli TaxID=413434 RepID=A0A1T4K1P0_9BACT|nr:hypothetical protein [Sediminibacterium ginsengisoli]SJZ36392.1 hypothetical protein SAMN04488132_101396 [Sediminibacterium ginsengisoli]